MPIFCTYAENDCNLTVTIKNEKATEFVPDIEVRIWKVAYLESGIYYLTKDFASSGNIF